MSRGVQNNSDDLVAMTRLVENANVSMVVGRLLRASFRMLIALGAMFMTAGHAR